MTTLFRKTPEKEQDFRLGRPTPVAESSLTGAVVFIIKTKPNGERERRIKRKKLRK